MGDEIASAWERRILLGVFLGGLLLLSYVILHQFLVPMVWAGILVYVTWPLYRRLRLLLRGRASIGALVMTLFLFMAFALPLLSVVPSLPNWSNAPTRRAHRLSLILIVSQQPKPERPMRPPYSTLTPTRIYDY